MRLSELRPCDNCGGVLHQGGIFYVLRFSIAVINAMKANQVLGLTQMLGGALGLAEAMAPEDDVVAVGMDEDPELKTEWLLCPACSMGEIDLGRLLSKAQKRNEADDTPA